MARKTAHASRLLLEEAAPFKGEGNVKEIEVCRAGTFFDERYGDFAITIEMLQQMVDNFASNVRKIKAALDFNHESWGPAAGWFTKIWIQDQSLMGEVELTDVGQEAVNNKRYGYISIEFEYEYMDNETKAIHGCVFHGAGLCNRPVIKGMKPVAALSDQLSKTISSLVREGHTQEQAVAIALTMIKDGSFSEGENRMTKDEEQKMGEMEKKLSDLSKVLEMLGVASAEEAIAKIKDMQSAETAMKSSTDTAQSKLAMAEKNVRELRGQLDGIKKTASFDKMLSEGKVVEAQRESFLKGDMSEFAEKAKPTKLAELGHGGEGEGSETEGKKLSEDALFEKAKELMSAGKASDIRTAIKLARAQ